MYKFTGVFLGAAILFSSTFSGVAKAEPSKDVDPYFEKSIVIGKEDLTNKQTSLFSNKMGDYKLGTTDILLPTKNEIANEKLEFLDSVDIDLTMDAEILEAKKIAIDSGSDLDLVSVVANTKYVDSNGKLLTESDIERMIAEKGKVTFLDAGNLGIGENPTFEKIKEWELKEEIKEIKRNSAEYSAKKVHVQTGYKVYKQVTAYLYVYEEKSGTTKRNYLHGKYVWPNKGTAGDVVNTASDFKENEILLLAWNRGPTGTSGYRNASLTYEDLYSTAKKTVKPATHTDEGTTSAAYKLNALPSIGGKRHVLRQANVYAYTGWYTPSKFGDDGSATAQYAHEVENVALSGFSISSGTAVSVSFSAKTKYEYAKVWATLPR